MLCLSVVSLSWTGISFSSRAHTLNQGLRKELRGRARLTPVSLVIVTVAKGKKLRETGGELRDWAKMNHKDRSNS